MIQRKTYIKPPEMGNPTFRIMNRFKIQKFLPLC